jgi:putative MATE family efflux protein
MTKNLTEGNPAKLIFFFTMPLIAGNIFQQLYAFVDTLLVGRFLGVDALAAVGCTGSLMFFMIGFVIGLTTGFSIYTGQRFGANDEEGVRRSAAACVVLSIVSAIILTVFGTLLCRTFLIWMQTPAEILDDATRFISIVYGGVSVTVMFNMLSNLIRALGDSRTPLYFMILATVINIILEVLFILVFGWGVSGAAAATVTAQLLSNLFCILYIVKKLPILHIRREDWHLSKRFLWEHLKVGLPMGFQASIIAIGAIVLQIALNHLGPVAVAAYAAAQKVDAVAVMPMMSFGMAMAAYTAQNYGAKKIDRIEKGVNQCILMSGTFSILVGLFNIFCGPYIMHMFVGDGQQQVIDYGHMYLTVNGVNYFVLSLLFVYRYTLQGLGQNMVPTIAGIVELLMRAGAAIVLVNYFGYIGACFANPMAWIGSCLPLAAAYYITRRGLRKSYAKVYSNA